MRVLIRRVVPLALVAVVVLLVPIVAAGDSEEGVNGVWHRDNAGVSHEQLVCSGPEHRVTCTYGALGESGGTQGDFHGVVAVCEPPWEGSAVCDEATSAVRGQMTFYDWQGQFVPFSIGQMIVLYGDGHMELVWEEAAPSGFGPFHCPWYRSWGTAQAEPADCTLVAVD